jgi:putative sigma-54 modulation protein
VRTIVKGKNLDVTEQDRQYVQRKMQRLERLLDDRSEALVELSVEQVRNADASRIVEVTLSIDGRILRGVGRAATHRAAADEVIDKLERRAVDHKERPRERARSADHRERPGIAPVSAASTDEAEAPRIVKIKRFAIEPMFDEDAVARMEELGHDFFVFVDAETERLAVLYRRNDGDYGLIEPTIGGAYTTGQGRRRLADAS